MREKQIIFNEFWSKVQHTIMPFVRKFIKKNFNFISSVIKWSFVMKKVGAYITAKKIFFNCLQYFDFSWIGLFTSKSIKIRILKRHKGHMTLCWAPEPTHPGSNHPHYTFTYYLNGPKGNVRYTIIKNNFLFLFQEDSFFRTSQKMIKRVLLRVKKTFVGVVLDVIYNVEENKLMM